MNTNNVLTDFYVHPKARERRRQNNLKLRDLPVLAKDLVHTPPEWNIIDSISYDPESKGLNNDLEDLCDFTRHSSERDILTRFLKRVMTNFNPHEFVVKPYVRIDRFERTGEWIEMRTVAESTFLLYALGPFSYPFDPWAYKSQEHKDYRAKLAMFGTRAYRFMEASADIRNGAHLNTIVTYYEILGDAFRTLAWDRQ